MGEQTPRDVAIEIAARECRELDKQIAELQKQKADIYRRYPELIARGHAKNPNI